MTLPGQAPSIAAAATGSAVRTRVARIVTGLAILGAFLPMVWADAVGLRGAAPARWLLPVALLLAAGAGGELGAILSRRGLGPRIPLLVGGCVALPLAAALGNPAFHGAETAGNPLATVGRVTLAMVAVTMLATTVELALYRSGGGALERLAGTALGLVSVGLPMAFLVALRLVGTPNYEGGWHAPGLMPLVAVIAAVKSGDVLAYLVGSTIGRHRMAPTLSPGKTWEGACGSIVGALLASWIVLIPLRATLTPEGAGHAEPYGGWLLHGLLVGVAGIVGDLAESLLKREAGVKDSGASLGALGGAFDLVDSLIFAAPTAWVLWLLSFPS